MLKKSFALASAACKSFRKASKGAFLTISAYVSEPSRLRSPLIASCVFCISETLSASAVL